MKATDTIPYSLSKVSNPNSLQHFQNKPNLECITKVVSSSRRDFSPKKVNTSNETEVSFQTVENTPSLSPHQNIKPLNISSRVYDASYIPQNTYRGFTKRLNSSGFVPTNNSYFYHEPIRQDQPLPDEFVTVEKPVNSSASSSVPSKAKHSLPG